MTLGSRSVSQPTTRERGELNADLLPKWRTRPAVAVTADDLLAVINAKLRDGAPYRSRYRVILLS
jgi:hypothetical protein